MIRLIWDAQERPVAGPFRVVSVMGMLQQLPEFGTDSEKQQGAGKVFKLPT
jgi:hypothetical protein